eukprot:CCRYP_015383-RA/>CCRYP_015383-RA protein AED:0.15 eAED:0.15 QI:225/1/1/1/1/1/2/578/225
MVEAALPASRASPLLVLLLLTITSTTASPSFHSVPSFLPAQRQPLIHDSSITMSAITTKAAILSVRGGDEYDSEDDSEYDSEEEAEPIAVAAKKLATATKSSLVQEKTKQTKARVSAVLSSSSGTAIKSGVGGGRGITTYYKRYVPHIVRACLNPFMLVKMTRAYFASLVDIHYLKEEPSQNLRSALEEKARKQSPPAGGSSNKPKRKMKPGQAKTLSDLPQLSA